MNMDLENEIAQKFANILDEYQGKVSGSTMIGIMETIKSDLLHELYRGEAPQQTHNGPESVQ